MPSNHVTIETKFSDGLYDCIQQNGSSMIQEPSRPQHLSGNLHMPQPQTNNGHHNHPEENNGTTSPHSSTKMKSLEIDHRDNHDNHDYYNNNNNNNHHSPQHAQQERQNNENLLGTAFCTFMSFATVQTIVAVFAKSEAMLGDSAAMIVDALTYLFNWHAERKKAHFETPEWAATILMTTGNDNDETRQRVLDRTRRKQILQLELVPPLISVSTLLIVTGFVLHQSVRVLVLDVHRSIDKQGNPNIEIMMYFSIANLGLDLVNVANFAKAKHLFGYETNEYQPPQGHEALTTHEDAETGKAAMYSPSSTPDNHHNENNGDGSEDEEEQEDQDHTANLNMCSAYTHVFADTLRSIAVLVASSISELVEWVTPEEADAAAAVVVSALIILSLIPLLNGLVQSSRELQLIRAEEKQDEILFSSSSSTTNRQ
ncbi:expressed unknown protein [Seminavis robusta]|uniref:Cation efflux protein transmembrane domain-containing protein n=1 Tax=Seminavis robusta TaxID=568900 RepID=A0A9N8E222_9STRA|nr:expressed unknown protein [Seminavis robusta]|eukprot:Sro569_g168330.1 n/a (428) ;mRNA; f:21167-22551